MNWQAFLKVEIEKWSSIKTFEVGVFMFLHGDQGYGAAKSKAETAFHLCGTSITKYMGEIYTAAAADGVLLPDRRKFKPLRTHLFQQWQQQHADRLLDNSPQHDWEKAAVRIWGTPVKGESKGEVVGTGFLIAPGYVLTCAHVVLQSLGLRPFSSCQNPSDQLINLDFPVGSEYCEMQAEVVAWQPYDMSQGDVAVLRLKEASPVGVSPLRIAQSSSRYKGGTYPVYGFADVQGCTLDVCLSEVFTNDNRLSLQKVGQPNDETIKASYSGAPVWDNEKSCVIGMVTMIEEQQSAHLSKAYLITREKLELVLKKVSALHLEDVLVQALEAYTDDEQKCRLERRIDDMIKCCDSEHDVHFQKTSKREAKLCALATDRLPPSDRWKREGRLIWFVIRLLDETIREKLISSHVFVALQGWVTQQGFDDSELLTRWLSEQPKQSTPGQSILQLAKQNVIVVVRHVNESDEALVVSMWKVADRDKYDVNHPPSATLLNEVMVDQKVFIEKIRQAIRRAFDPDKPVVHLFVPPDLLNHNLEMQPVSVRMFAGLGCEYPVVLRLNLEECPEINSDLYKRDLESKWAYIESKLSQQAGEVFESVDCSQSQDQVLYALKSAEVAIILENTENPYDVAELFSASVAEEFALPAVLWVRSSACTTAPRTVLDGVFGQLLEHIRQERDRAYRQSEQEEKATLLGYHLGFVWEDQKILPPTAMVSLNSEAC